MEQKKQQIERIAELGRVLGTATIFFHQTAARSVGLSGSDHKYVDILMRHGSMPAGELAKATGLTTGAVTGIIDRLERHGLVHRRPDKDDRRRIVVVLNRERAIELLGPAFQGLGQKMYQFLQGFSKDELEVVSRYLRGATKLLTEETEKVAKR